MEGHILDVVKGFPSESIDCVVTSPPYWSLRNYGSEPQVWDVNPACKHQRNMARPMRNRSFYIGKNSDVSNHKNPQIWRIAVSACWQGVPRVGGGLSSISCFIRLLTLFSTAITHSPVSGSTHAIGGTLG